MLGVSILPECFQRQRLFYIQLIQFLNFSHRIISILDVRLNVRYNKGDIKNLVNQRLYIEN